jgi:argininosuccinate lyase
MPQKRNPDAAELVRGKAGQAIGALVQLLVVLKGLPLTYGKDMQEDKETVFLTVDNLSLSLAAMTGMVRDLTADTGAMRQACDRGFITATDLADGLVRDLGLAFREAHHITGTLVRLAEQKGCGLAELPLAEMQRVEPRITAELRAGLTVEAAVEGRTSLGGTAPANVRRAVAMARARLTLKRQAEERPA